MVQFLCRCYETLLIKDKRWFMCLYLGSFVYNAVHQRSNSLQKSLRYDVFMGPLHLVHYEMYILPRPLFTFLDSYHVRFCEVVQCQVMHF